MSKNHKLFKICHLHVDYDDYKEVKIRFKISSIFSREKLGKTYTVIISIIFLIFLLSFLCKKLLTRCDNSSLLTLYISVARHWIFLSWMETELTFFKRILKDDCLSSYIIRKHKACLVFHLSYDFHTSRSVDCSWTAYWKKHSWPCVR